MKNSIQKMLLAFVLTFVFNFTKPRASNDIEDTMLISSPDGFTPSSLLVIAQKPTPEQEAFYKTHLHQQVTSIDEQFYQSKALNEPGSYEHHETLAQQYIHEFLGRDESETTWGRKTNETQETYQQRITHSAAHAMSAFFPSTDYGDFVTFEELVNKITDQFIPFDIQGQDPWFIPPQGGHNPNNWLDFTMDSRGKVHSFLYYKQDIKQVNLRLFEGVTAVEKVVDGRKLLEASRRGLDGSCICRKL